MYEYKFVKIELKSSLMKSQPKEGWRFVQIFAPSTVGYGSAAYFELIFERTQTI